jgi:hypothetical protein
MLKVKSVEGFEYELEGLAEKLVREDPKIKVMITPMDEKGEVIKTLEGAFTTFVILVKNRKVILEIVHEKIEGDDTGISSD